MGFVLPAIKIYYTVVLLQVQINQWNRREQIKNPKHI